MCMGCLLCCVVVACTNIVLCAGHVLGLLVMWLCFAPFFVLFSKICSEMALMMLCLAPNFVLVSKIIGELVVMMLWPALVFVFS
jgi:hypothetical protein